MIGHATFCVVVVYNNVLARLRRTSVSPIEASMDLGADGFSNLALRHPAEHRDGAPGRRHARRRPVVLRGIVATSSAGRQTTLPIWMLSELVRPRQRPVTNVETVFVIAAIFVPILIAYYLTMGTKTAAGGGR